MIEAIEPSIVGGAGEATPRRSRRTWRAATTASWLAAMRAGQPPGRSAPMASIAAGIDR